ncbi:MAG TPA: UDP-N-acetylmuramoyl-L-alanyl-D-glutamate--2,6-diaminopimelate ligase [Candidatus Saccharimonadia bacterium]|nr:UDP-N-acetylmuramoyl-L-alanyl-D-glutamate--2,6-diaminopimelate ligase [Candidatus Saccharimonadia bacterium]
MIRRIVKAVVPKQLFKQVMPAGHLVEAALYNAKNGFPTQGLKVIGVTGTNGKTTTVMMIHRMLHEAGYKVGMMSTVAYGVGADIKPQMKHMTTSSAPVVFGRMKAMRAKGIEWLVLEVTSHALHQNRVWGVPFSVAVVTNLTHEHLSYHGTFENYRKAKRKLFQMTDANMNGLRTGFVNADDPEVAVFATDISYPVMYGVDKGELRASNVKLSSDGVSYTATHGDKTYQIKTQLPGSFNVYNSLAAVGVGEALGLSPEQIEKGIAALEGVEGRMNRIDEGQDFTVIVDYAHSPDSFDKLFADLRPVVKGKLIAVFGSQGSTGDVAKRGIQGKLAGQYADEVVLTEEDDRGEDGEGILKEIAGGAEAAGKVRDKDLFLVHDRTEAIEFAMGRAKAGDTVILLGKGHEKTIQRADVEEPWDEAGAARAALKKRSSR